MRKNAALTLLILFVAAAPAFSQKGKVKEKKDPYLGYTAEQLDTADIQKKFFINDYSYIGVEYGVSLNSQNFNPAYSQKKIFFPDYYGVTYTRYCKMFGFMPYFGLQAGLFYGHEGYEFKEDEETHSISTIEGATKVTYDIVEVPLLAEFHVDVPHFKLMADIGPYAGYRLKINREGNWVEEGMENKFLSTDRRLDYGLHGGAGFSVVFAPLEFQVKLRVRYSWSNLFEPDYASQYYYRFAYPFDFMLTAGVHFHLTKRTGRTKESLRKQAYDEVFGN